MRRYAILLLLAALHAPAIPQDLSLGEMLSHAEAKLEWDALGGNGAFVKDEKRVFFSLDVPWLLVSGDERIPVESPRRTAAGISFPRSFADAVASKLANKPSQEKKGKYSVAAIVIDAGHGGKDPGSIASHLIGKKTVKLVEKEITLEVSRYLESLLKTRYPGRKIIMTRTQDTYPSLEDRVEIANKVKTAENEAIVFISIHANASFNKKAKGFEVWYLSPDYRRNVIDDMPGSDDSILPIINSMLADEYTTESIIIAKNILERMREAMPGMGNRGIKAEEWFVVRNAKMPSVLVELGFITNPEDGKLLSDTAYLKKAAEGIYNGLVDFIAYFEESKGFTE